MNTYQEHIDSTIIRSFLRILCFSVIVLSPSIVGADNNIEFLDKNIIASLRFSVVEVVVPKVESKKIQYTKELPFDKLSFTERNEQYFSIGTAFFINEKELMTAAHVLSLEYFSLLNDFYIRDSNGQTFKIGQIKKLSSRRDMTIFDLETYPDKILALDISKHVDIGDTVFSVGNAQGEGISFRAGQVASFTPERELGLWKDIRFTSPASPGNSGGPLLNLDGKIVGLIIQKNASENYNVAVPITELENLKDTADFSIKNISISLNGELNTYSMDWSKEIDLPANIQLISKRAQQSLNSFYEKVSSGAYKKYEAAYFPKGKRFRAYLRNQKNIRQFGVLKSDADFNTWSLNNYSARVSPINEEQSITLSKSDLSTGHVIVEKPKGVTLKDFLESPKQVMDNLLKALHLTRTMGAEKIRLISLGDPENTESWEDKLGRPWISSLWHLPHNDYFVYSHCLAYPKGVICNIDIKETWHLRTGYISRMKEDLNEVVVGYEGELHDWIEYFSLGEKYLPAAFNRYSIRASEKSLHIDLHDFRLVVQSNTLREKSSLHFHFGYSNKKLLEEELLLFELFPQKGSNAHYRIHKFFSPSIFSSDEYKAKWDEISNKSGDFSEKALTNNTYQEIRKVLSGREEEFLTVDGDTIKRELVIVCRYKLSEEDVQSKCGNFIDRIHFTEEHSTGKTVATSVQ